MLVVLQVDGESGDRYPCSGHGSERPDEAVFEREGETWA